MNRVRGAFGKRALESREEPAYDLNSFSRNDWEPLYIGEKFFVTPSWLDAETPPGRFRLTVDSTIAFGTGRHESTQLAIHALEKYLQPGFQVLDIGCGSGILSLAASKLGATRVVSCDADSKAIGAARQHIATPLFQGSADSVRASFADLTIANISSRVVDRLASQLKRVTKPGGRLILAGFLRENPPRRFQPDEVLELEGWLCWICRPGGVLPSPTGEADPAALQDAQRWWM